MGWGTQRFIRWLAAEMEGGLKALRFCTCIPLARVLFTWLPWGQVLPRSLILPSLYSISDFALWLARASVPFAGAVFCSLGQLQFPLDNQVMKIASEVRKHALDVVSLALLQKWGNYSFYSLEIVWAGLCEYES